MTSLRIMSWLTWQFLYFLSQWKLGAAPSLPPIDMLLQHTQTKTLDGFLGCLLVSWLEQVKPANQKSSGGTSSSNKSSIISKGSRVTNANWTASIKKHWEVANLVSLNKMLEAKDPNATTPLPKFGDMEACLSWLIKGRCFDNCQHVSMTHKQAGAAIMVTQVHTLLNACGIPVSN